MKRSNELIKRAMYAFNSPLKDRHLNAFLRYNSARKLRNLLRVHWAMRTGATRDFGHPYVLNLETTNHCNLRCTLCPTGRRLPGRPRQMAPIERIRRVIDEIGEYVYIANLQAWGEPLLSKETPEVVDLCHRNRIFTAINTNGNYPTRFNDDLVRAGLDHITIAVDGATQDVYEQYRVGGSLARVEENVRDLLERKRSAGARLFVEVQFLVFGHNRHQREAVCRMARSWGVDGLLVRAGSSPGSEDDQRRYYTWMYDRKGFCSRPWYTTTINADGGVSACCNYFFAQDDFGSVAEGSLDATWNGETYTRTRRAMVDRDVRALTETCRSCDIYTGPGSGNPMYSDGQGPGAAEPPVQPDRTRHAMAPTAET